MNMIVERNVGIEKYEDCKEKRFRIITKKCCLIDFILFVSFLHVDK